MLGSRPIIGFVATKDFGRAQTFYGGTLGLRFIANDGFALVFERAGIMIRVVKAGGFLPAPYTILGWQVEAMQETVTALTERGVVFERDPGLEQDKFAIWTAPGGAQVAWFKDPDGNLLSVSHHRSVA
jgi:catechol 2,3-dioxygenase-like lactoylglutathione lyase family enzyme